MKYYVYELWDMIKNEPFYVGKGNPQFGKTWSDEKRNKMNNSIKGSKRPYRADGTWSFTYPEKV